MVINFYYWSFVVAVIFRHAISGHPFIKPLCIVIISIEISAQILVVCNPPCCCQIDGSPEAKLSKIMLPLASYFLQGAVFQTSSIFELVNALPLKICHLHVFFLPVRPPVTNMGNSLICSTELGSISCASCQLKEYAFVVFPNEKT